MRKISEREIKHKMYELKYKNEKSMSKTDHTFFGIILIMIISLIVSGLGKLFSK